MNALQTHTVSHIGRLFSWLVTGVVAFLCTLIGLLSPRLLEPFAAMFQALQVELPWPTRLLFATGTWFFPLFFISLAVFAVVKELSTRELRRKFLLTTRVFFVTLGTIALVIFILYLPLLTLAAKLVETK